MTRDVRFVAGLLCALSLCHAARAAATAHHRTVEVRWDFRQGSPDQLEVWIDCERPAGADVLTCDDAKKIKSPDSYNMVFQPSDRIVFILISAPADDEQGDIAFAVNGTDLNQKDLEALKKLFGATAAAKALTSEPPKLHLERPAIVIKPLSDDLIAGGKLTVNFTIKKKGAAGKETVTDTSGALTFRIEGAPPRFTVSYGIGLTTAATPTVALSRTSTIVSFQKDGKAQQAYQQVITMKDADVGAKPVQSLMTAANFHVAGPVYASVGVQVNEKLFEEPVVGGTYRHGVGRVGLNVTLGVHFSHETEIIPESGFSVGQTIDPTVGLTADDIPTRKAYHRRIALLLSLDF